MCPQRKGHCFFSRHATVYAFSYKTHKIDSDGYVIKWWLKWCVWCCRCWSINIVAMIKWIMIYPKKQKRIIAFTRVFNKLYFHLIFMSPHTQMFTANKVLCEKDRTTDCLSWKLTLYNQVLNQFDVLLIFFSIQFSPVLITKMNTNEIISFLV